MTSSQPPFPYYNGIEYNSAYFTSIDSGLTIAQANAKYLKKTVADTATATETFSSGILTDAINPTTTTGTIQIGQTATNSNVEIAAQASRSTVLHLGDGNLSSGGIHIGNGNGASNNVQILNGNYASFQTAGDVNILSGTFDPNVNGGNCNLFTGSSGTLTVGSLTATAINFGKKTTFTQGLVCSSLEAVATNSTLAFGANLQADGAITIANNALQTGGINIGAKGRAVSNNNIAIGGASQTATIYSSTLNIGVSGGTLNVNAPLTPGYNPSAITSGKIGYSITPTYNTPFNLTASVVKNIATYSLPIGVYFIQASILTPTVVTYQGLGISSTSATIEYDCWSNILTDGYVWLALCVSRMVVITTASTPYYVIAQAGDLRTLLQVRTQCFRIA
jgi:hypothetical protein